MSVTTTHVPSEDLADRFARVESISHLSRLDGEMLTFNVAGAGTEIELTICRGDEVREVATELADRDLPIEPEAPTPDLDVVRRCGVRCVLEYDIDTYDEVVNTSIIVAGDLENACTGIIFHPTSDLFP